MILVVVATRTTRRFPLLLPDDDDDDDDGDAPPPPPSAPPPGDDAVPPADADADDARSHECEYDDEGCERRRAAAAAAAAAAAGGEAENAEDFAIAMIAMTAPTATAMGAAGLMGSPSLSLDRGRGGGGEGGDAALPTRTVRLLLRGGEKRIFVTAILLLSLNDGERKKSTIYYIVLKGREKICQCQNHLTTISNSTDHHDDTISPTFST